jgi:uncharacterized RDD family membrane protein YckC
VIPYVGLVTRAIAFGLDAALINLVALLVGAVVALTFSVLSLPNELEVVAAAAGGVLYLLAIVGYFTTFWTTTGQTPGSRALGIRVTPAEGDVLSPRRALLRFVGLTLAALPLFLGFLWILVDDRRRGLHDRMARTVVVDAPRVSAVVVEGHPAVHGGAAARPGANGQRPADGLDAIAHVAQARPLAAGRRVEPDAVVGDVELEG